LTTGLNLAGKNDPKRFLDVFLPELSRRALTGAQIKKCDPILDWSVAKFEQCAASGDRECRFSQQEANEINELSKAAAADPPECEEALKRRWILGEACPETLAKERAREEERDALVKNKLCLLNLSEEETVHLTSAPMMIGACYPTTTDHELDIAGAITGVVSGYAWGAANKRATMYMREWDKATGCLFGRTVLKKYGMLE
jgi:hypothetical protein